MTRLNRRRMSMPTNFRRKIKSTNYRKIINNKKTDNDDSNHSNENLVNNGPYNDDHLAIPSTSTGKNNIKYIILRI
jgi:hypothetical protein